MRRCWCKVVSQSEEDRSSSWGIPPRCRPSVCEGLHEGWFWSRSFRWWPNPPWPPEADRKSFACSSCPPNRCTWAYPTLSQGCSENLWLLLWLPMDRWRGTWDFSRGGLYISSKPSRHPQSNDIQHLELVIQSIPFAVWPQSYNNWSMPFQACWARFAVDSSLAMRLGVFFDFQLATESPAEVSWSDEGYWDTRCRVTNPKLQIGVDRLKPLKWALSGRGKKAAWRLSPLKDWPLAICNPFDPTDAS